jgi:hypothetical protein
MLKREVEADNFTLSHCPCFELLVRPSGSFASLSIMKKWIDPRTKS